MSGTKRPNERLILSNEPSKIFTLVCLVSKYGKSGATLAMLRQSCREAKLFFDNGVFNDSLLTTNISKLLAEKRIEVIEYQPGINRMGKRKSYVYRVSVLGKTELEQVFSSFDKLRRSSKVFPKGPPS